jgi:hypothetical protein
VYLQTNLICIPFNLKIDTKRDILLVKKIIEV